MIRGRGVGLLLSALILHGAQAQTVSVSGTVRDALTGQPIAGATVNWGRSGSSEWNTQTTGADGRYAFTHAEAPELWILVKHPDYFDSGYITFPAPAGQPIVGDVTLNPKWGAVRGRVRGNMPDGSRPPVADADVEVWYEGQLSTSTWRTKTDANGEFEVTRLLDSDGWNPPRTYTVEIKNHPDYFRKAITSIVIEGGRTNFFDILVDPKWGVVRGQITTISNRTILPLEGAKVELWFPGQISTSVPWRLTDTNGQYEFERVLDSLWRIRESGSGEPRNYFIDVSRSGYFALRNQPAPPVQGGTTNIVNLRLLSAFGSLEGYVYGQMPTAGYAPSEEPLANVNLSLWNGFTWIYGRTDSNGWYRFDRVPASYKPDGTLNVSQLAELEINSPPAPFDRGGRIDIVITSGRTTRVDVHLETVMGTLTGTVRSAANNEPIEGVSVFAQGSGAVADYSGPSDTVTFVDGSYELSLPIGTYTVTARDPGFAPQTNTVQVTRGATTLNFLLTPHKAVIYYRVRNGTSSAPVPSAQVRLESLNAQPPVTQTSTADANGNGGFTQLEPGQYRLTAQAPGFETMIKTAEAVQTRTVVPVLFPLIPAGQAVRLTGVVLDDATGAPIPDAEVWAESEKTATDAQGRFEFRLAPGVYRVQAFKPGYRRDVLPNVFLSANETEESVTLRLQPIPPETLVLTPDPLNFGTYGWSDITRQNPAPVVARHTVRITNPNIFPMHLTALGLRGADASQFRILRARVAGGMWQTINAASTNPDLEIPAKGAVQVEIGFTPSREPMASSYLARMEVAARAPSDEATFANVTLLARLGQVRWAFDVLDATLISDVDPQSGALRQRGSGQPWTEPTLAGVADDSLSRLGLTADGEARLFIRYQINRNLGGFISFTLKPPAGAGGGTEAGAWGSLGTFGGDQGAITLDRPLEAVGSNLWQATVVLRAPDTFPVEDIKSGKARLVVEPHPATGSAGVLSFDTWYEVQRAPVVLIHGLWADASSWGNARQGMIHDLRDKGYTVATFEYPNWKGPSETMRAGPGGRRDVLMRTVLGLIIEKNQHRIACARVNFVGHSMGGLVSRAFLQRNPELARRLITLGTPHKGSGFANFLSFYNPDAIDCCNCSLPRRATTRALRTVLHYTGKPIGSAIMDLSIGSPFLTTLNSSEQKVRAYGVAGEASTSWLAFGLSVAATAAAGCDYAELFQGWGSDGVVPLNSAVGNLSGHFTIINNAPHTGMGTNPDIIQETLRLLELPSSELAPSIRPSGSSTPAPKAWSSVLSQRRLGTKGADAPGTGQLSLTVDPPTAAPGAQLQFTASAAGAHLVQVTLTDGHGLDLPVDQPPYMWTVQAPADTAGTRSYWAVALTDTGEVLVSDTVTVQLEADLTLLDAIWFANDTIELLSGQSRNLTLLGRLIDGTELELTTDPGTTYSELIVDGLTLTEGDSPVIAVDAQGRVTALAPGAAVVRARHGMYAATIQVIVQPVADNDADGDGLADETETNLGTNPFNPDSDQDGVNDADEIGPDPAQPRDSDGDGAIDALDADSATLTDYLGGLLVIQTDAGSLGEVSAQDTPFLEPSGTVMEGVPLAPAVPSLRIADLGGAGTATLTVRFESSRALAGDVYVLSPTSDGRVAWQPVSGAVITGNQLQLTLADGGPFDASATPGEIQILGLAAADQTSPPPVVLHAQPGPDGVLLWWDAGLVGYRLQAADSVDGPWQDVPTTGNRLTLSPDQAQQFFRLILAP